MTQLADPSTPALQGIPTDQETVRRGDRAHVFHSWSAQAAIDPLPIARAEGSRFWDYDGKGYLDFSSQLVNVNIGYQHPKLVAAIQEQAGRLLTIAPTFANDARSEAARLIAELAPGDLNMVFFTNGGAEANENAIRLARLHTGRHKILAAYRSYHGATAGSVAVTGDPRRWPSEPGMPGVVRHWGPYAYRSAFHSTTEEEECERGLQHLRDTIMVEGPGTVAAIILETVVGTNGILVPPDGYLAGVRQLCDEHGILLIVDEVMSGFGRCGEWFAVDRWDVTPDLITFAKGVNSGYVPLGGVVISDRSRRPSRTGPSRAGSPTPDTPSPARPRSPRSASSARSPSSSTPGPSAGTSSGPSCAPWRSGIRPSERCGGWACSGPSSWCATGIRASRWSPSTPRGRTRRPWGSSRPPARRRGCGRSPTSTAPMSYRRAPRRRRRSARASPSSTTRSRWPTATTQVPDGRVPGGT